jgi:hypothetical protein
MKIRCSPCNALLSFGILGIFILCHAAASAQCSGDFTYQSISSSKEPSSGKIEISVKSPESGTYTFKVYKMDAQLTLVQSREASSPEKITLEGLPPSPYLVKIEWGNGCSRLLGGLDGILITRKEEVR